MIFFIHRLFCHDKVIEAQHSTAKLKSIKKQVEPTSDRLSFGFPSSLVLLPHFPLLEILELGIYT